MDCPDTSENGVRKPPGIEDFKIVKAISRGAFGKVFLGYKKSNPEQFYAIKVMRKEEMINKNMVNQVTMERNALATTHSPYCVHLFYSLQSNTSVYLVMEYLIGGDLKSLLSMYGYFDEKMATFYVAEVTMALLYLHRHGIIHRDIKPDNMLLTATGHVKLTDFGLSRVSTHKHDLEVDDLLNQSPDCCMSARTPGQIFSLTSHLSFGSCERSKSLLHQPEIMTENRLIINAFRTYLNESKMEMDASVGPVAAQEGNLNCGLPMNDASEGTPSTQTINTEKKNIKENCILLNASSRFHNSQVTPRVIELSCVDTDEDSQNEKFNSTDSFHTCMDFSTSESSFHNRQLSSPPPRKIESDSDEEDADENESLAAASQSVETEEEAFDDLDMDSDPQQSRKRKFRETDNGKSPLRGVLKNRGDPFEFEVPGMVSTPISAFSERGFNQPLLKKTRFLLPDKQFEPENPELQLELESDSQTPFSPILTPHSSKVFNNYPVLRRSGSSTYGEGTSRGTVGTPPHRCLLSAHNAGGASSSNAQVPYHSAEGISRSTDAPSPRTPYRTPKSLRSKTSISSASRIMGTPDYLAPELLTSGRHGPEVDWWALGVCLYEFMTGVLPFNDATPEAVFNNILTQELEWPEGDEALSDNARQSIEALLTRDPAARACGDRVLQLRIFQNIDWDNLRNCTAPFIPKPDDEMDTSYFSARNQLQNLNLSHFSWNVSSSMLMDCSGSTGHSSASAGPTL